MIIQYLIILIRNLKRSQNYKEQEVSMLSDESMPSENSELEQIIFELKMELAGKRHGQLVKTFLNI